MRLVPKFLELAYKIYMLSRSFAERPKTGTKFAVGFLHMGAKEVFERTSAYAEP